jgi:ParB family chromosome partitioning protein
VRETERMVQEALRPSKAARTELPKLDADGRRLQEDLSESLGATVQIRPRSGGKGSLVIEYASLDQLDGLVKRLRK